MRPFVPAALAAVTALAAAAPALAAPPRADAKFLREAVQGDTAEIQMGRMAERQAASPAVRDLGRTLIADHTDSRAKAERTARMTGVRVSRSPPPQAASTAQRLSRMHGPQFDRAWLEAAVKDHRKDIAEYRREADRGYGPVRDHARETLPTLQKHLDAAEAAERGMRG